MTRHGIRVLIVAALAVLSMSPVHAQTKLVFANYMVCNRDFGGSVEGYKKDIRDAQAYGIDGFVLDAGVWDAAHYKEDTASIFKAVHELKTDFKLFFMVESQTPAEISDMIRTYAKDPNYFRYKNRPMLTNWSSGGGPEQLNRWRKQVLDPLRSDGFNVYFVPFFYTADLSELPKYDNFLANYNSWWKDTVDGMFYFGAAGTPLAIAESGESLARVMHDHGHTYMAPISPQYWGNKQPQRRYFEYKGGEGLAIQWDSIIARQKPEWINIVTWNDFDEATHVTPMDDVTKHWPYTAHTSAGYYQNRSGLLKLNEYYIDWYKHYAPDKAPPPPGGRDNLYYAYRTHPKDVIATDDKSGPVLAFYGGAPDTLFVTTILTKPATLVVTTGDSVTKIDVPKGIHHSSVPFRVGDQKFELLRDGKVLLSAIGDPIRETVKEYNFIYTSGWAHN
ncbi:MAG TPA: endo-1,3-alpha-glucanase family glycosylhydrolase [Capsulimonadaceae bacterium]|jgi:glucan endo-1,3-alpha-glucosidase